MNTRFCYDSQNGGFSAPQEPGCQLLGHGASLVRMLSSPTSWLEPLGFAGTLGREASRGCRLSRRVFFLLRDFLVWWF